MKFKRDSYPDKIRRIADELNQMRKVYDVDHSVEQLRVIASELDRSFNKKPRTKA